MGISLTFLPGLVTRLWQETGESRGSMCSLFWEKSYSFSSHSGCSCTVFFLFLNIPRHNCCCWWAQPGPEADPSWSRRHQLHQTREELLEAPHRLHPSSPSVPKPCQANPIPGAVLLPLFNQSKFRRTEKFISAAQSCDFSPQAAAYICPKPDLFKSIVIFLPS